MIKIQKVFAMVGVFFLVHAGLNAIDVLPTMLARFKNATVFVKVRIGSRIGSGSAFLILKRKGVGYLATNAHVVSQGKSTHSLNIKVVFHSGTKDEFELPAKVVCLAKNTDIAILQVTSKKLPQPISLKIKADINETTKVLILGFPFGKMLSMTTGNPVITVSRGFVSSIRRNNRGVIGAIQIDGNINPGNSGGPVLTHNGALVGVSTATIIGTQIGLTLPKSHIINQLKGNLNNFLYEVKKSTKKKLTITVKVDFADPLDRISSATLLLSYKEKGMNLPVENLSGRWKKLKNAIIIKRIPLKSHEGNITLTIPVKNENDLYFAQIAFSRKGVTMYSKPQEWELGLDASYPVIVKNDDSDKGWLNDDQSSKSALSVLKPIKLEKNIAKTPSTKLDASVFSLDIQGEFASFPFWSRNGNIFYVLTKNGILHEISVPGLIDKRCLSIGSPCTHVALSKAGILVLNSAQQQLLIIDETTLAVKSRIDTGGLLGLAASPNSYKAFIGGGRELAMVDLKKKKIVARYVPHELNNKYKNRIVKHQNSVVLTEFGIPRMTPDGKYLFCVGFECLHRFRVSGTKLIYEEMGPRIGKGSRIEMSDDGLYIALPSGGGI